MTDILTRKKTDRFRFLNALYEKTNGDEDESVTLWDLGAGLGFSREASEQIVQYLVGEDLVKWVATGGQIGITHFGVTQVERALTSPQEPTEYFPPVVNVLNIGSMTGSQVQQAGSGAVFGGALQGADLAELSRIVQELRTALEQLPKTEELEPEIATIEAQLRRREPNRVIVRESLSTVRNVLEGMTGSLLAAGALPAIQALLARI